MLESYGALHPLLWNIFYDDLLKLKMTEGVDFIAFADDLAVLAKADDADELIDILNDRAKKHQLSIALEKTEAVIIKGKRKME